MGRALTWRLAPLILLLGAGAAAWFAGLDEALSVEALREQRAAFDALRAERPFETAAVFIIAYALIAASVPPGAALMVTAAGFLFGFGYGSALAMAGAMTGAIPPYLAARSAIGRAMQRRAGSRMQRLERMLEANAFLTVLTFRFLPVIPYFFLNLAAGLARVPLPSYAAATAIGLAPPTIALAALGDGAADALAAGEAFDLSLMARPGIFAPIIVIGLLTALTLALRLRSAYFGNP